MDDLKKFFVLFGTIGFLYSIGAAAFLIKLLYKISQLM